MQPFLLIGLSLLALWLVKQYVAWRRIISSVYNYPGLRVIFGPESFVFPFRIPYLAMGGMSLWTHKHKDFDTYNADIISSVNFWPTPKCTHFLADAEAIKEITSARHRFPKPLQQYKVLTFYGSNIVVTEADEWKRHRKISAPSFSERNNRLVWDESVRVVEELCHDVWSGKDVIELDNIVDLTVPVGHLISSHSDDFSEVLHAKMALFIIGVAGFGRRMSWKEEGTIPSGRSMTFKDALHIVSGNLALKVVFPTWLLKIAPFKIARKFNAAYIDLEQYMIQMVQERKIAEKKEERYDLFSSLLDANDVESDGTAKLSNSEVIGNIFVFLIAGHETTAHTLAYTFILLALYQDEQETLYQHIKNVIPDGHVASYEDMGKLSYCLAVFYETLRLFPPVNGIPKSSGEDTTLRTRNMAGESISVPCPAGTYLTIHTPALHYNPRYWEDPYAFKPARFMGDWPRDAFLPFSGGLRSCLGRRFSETEAVAILAYMIARFRVDVKDEPQFAKETFEQRKERLLKSMSAITLYPVRAPLVFKRR
ncbi:uncharacterized protein FIBRA_00267 [Fibroporia radiculosa]|uniref:Cytochrome P450 n=1 Tax=Fibroporia radiculosa TaxID=599839 RepID=J7SCN7_9APHY|nr:uncharacterized protein FIBRA_00267 [Fibroporia radiculosa]CCL98273.1 predicted protein [Fibroporia radiculosa]